MTHIQLSFSKKTCDPRRSRTQLLSKIVHNSDHKFAEYIHERVEIGDFCFVLFSGELHEKYVCRTVDTVN